MNRELGVEQFGDYINRIYGGKNLIPSITIQVCDYCSLCCTYCIDGDSQIYMADNTYKPIKDISVGDIVFGYDEFKPDVLIPAKVLNTFIHKSKVLEVHFSNGRKLIITDNHKVLTNDFLFKPIGDLSIGQSIYAYNDYFYKTTIISIKELSEEIDVYNIETETGTYIAEGLAVHNCYQINKQHHIMSFDTAKLFIDKLLTNEDNFVIDYFHEPLDGIILDFIGGEPFLQPNLIYDICTYFYKKCFELNKLDFAEKSKFSFSSNGVHYFEPDVQRYLNKFKNNISFSVSIDGNKELHDKCRVFPDGRGSYDVAIKAVNDWVSKGHYMGSKMTLAPANVMYTYDAVTSMVENGYNDINLNCVFEKGWLPEHATILYYELKRIGDYTLDNNLEDSINVSLFTRGKFEHLPDSQNECYCGGNGKMLAIDYKGDLYPCVRYMESSLGADVPPIIIGNIYTGFMKKQSEKDIVNKMQALNRKNYSPKECYDCPINDGCANCIACDYMYHKDFTVRTTFNCEMHKATALANIYYWNKYYRKKNATKRFVNNVPDEWALNIIPEKELLLLKELEKDE